MVTSDPLMTWPLSMQVDRWPHNGYVKKLQRRDGCFYYYNKNRECSDKDVNRTKMYAYWPPNMFTLAPFTDIAAEIVVHFFMQEV